MSKLKKVTPISKTDNESLPTQEEYKRKMRKANSDLDRYFIDELIDVTSNQEGNWVEDYVEPAGDSEWEEILEEGEIEENKSQSSRNDTLDGYSSATIELARTAMLMRLRTMSKEQEELNKKQKAGNDR